MPSVAELLAGGLDDTPSAPAQGRFNRVADALLDRARGVVEFPGNAMQNGLTTDQAVDWAAPMAMSMVGSPGVPEGALGSAGRQFKWTGLDAAEVGRMRALERRNEGGSTVRVFNTERALDQSRRPLTGWEKTFAEARNGWKNARDTGVADVRAAGVENPLLRDPYWDPFWQPRSLAERFEAASGARDVPGLANGNR